MKKLIIDGRRCKTKQLTWEYLAKKPLFPNWYGNNLDALHDVLTSLCEAVHIRVRYAASLEANLGGYGRTMLRVLREAAAENENITLEIL